MRTIAIPEWAPAKRLFSEAASSSAVRRMLVLPVAAAVLFGASACGSDSSNVPSDAIAVVGEQTVAKADLDRLVAQARANSNESRRPFPKPGTPQYSQIREQLVQFLVRRAQLAVEAEARGIEISDEQVEQRRDELVQRYFGGSEELYDKQLEKNGLVDEQVRADIEASLIQEALLADVGNDVKVSEAELRRYYTKNRRKYARPFGQVKKAVRGALLQTKRNEARSKYLVRLARKNNVQYQVGFAPRA
jgi:SurA N-terminal domain